MREKLAAIAVVLTTGAMTMACVTGVKAARGAARPRSLPEPAKSNDFAHRDAYNSAANEIV